MVATVRLLRPTTETVAPAESVRLLSAHVALAMTADALTATTTSADGEQRITGQTRPRVRHTCDVTLSHSVSVSRREIWRRRPVTKSHTAAAQTRTCTHRQTCMRAQSFACTRAHKVHRMRRPVQDLWHDRQRGSRTKRARTILRGHWSRKQQQQHGNERTKSVHGLRLQTHGHTDMRGKSRP